MLRKVLLILVLSFFCFTTDSINEDDHEWIQLTGDQLISVTQQSRLFQRVNAEAISFWLIYQKQTLSTITKIQQLLLNKVHYFRVTYKSAANPQMDRATITVRVKPTQKRKVMVTRSFPPISIADNADGYVTDY